MNEPWSYPIQIDNIQMELHYGPCFFFQVEMSAENSNGPILCSCRSDWYLLEGNKPTNMFLVSILLVEAWLGGFPNVGWHIEENACFFHIIYPIQMSFEALSTW